MPPTISDYYRYRAALEELKQDVERTPDDRVLGMDLEEWTNYLVEKFSMEEIALDDSRTDQMLEVDQERSLRRYDIYTDHGPGTVVRSTAIRVEVPVIPSDTVREIWKHKLSPNVVSLATAYPEFDYDDRRGVIHTVVASTAADVKRGIEHIKESIRKYNESIASENRATTDWRWTTAEGGRAGRADRARSAEGRAWMAAETPGARASRGRGCRQG